MRRVGAANRRCLLEPGLSACEELKAKGALKSSALWDGVELRPRLNSKSALSPACPLFRGKVMARRSLHGGWCYGAHRRLVLRATEALPR